MKKIVVISLLLLFVVHALLLLISYWFLLHQGFDLQSFFVASLMFLVASVSASYIVLSDIVDQKEEQDGRLEHMVNEVLHEIKLPIATIDANMSMIKKNLNAPKDIKRSDRVTAALHRLQRLYEELAYRIKKEIMPIEKQLFNLAELMEERIDVFKESSSCSFDKRLESCMIKVDRFGLEGVIDNIIENAIKHNKDSQNLTISIVIKDDILSIQDSGCGIDENDLAKIFVRYYQGNIGMDGSGIGLTLVKKYCDSEHIGIKIHSKSNKGTVVILDFGEVVAIQ